MLPKAQLHEFAGSDVIGEYESLKMAADPQWEWHTMDSVSFNVVGVVKVVNNGGSHGDEPQYNPPPGFKAVDRIEVVLRIRLYRQGMNQPWNNIGVSDRIPNAEGNLTTSKKLLNRKDYSYKEIDRMPGASLIPVLTQ